MLRATFQLIRGVGPQRERLLWAEGVTSWDDLRDRRDLPLPARFRDELLRVVDGLDEALAHGQLARLAAALPGREHWRLWSHFADRALCLDIETDQEEGVTAIGLLDGLAPRLFLARRNLHDFVRVIDPEHLLLTFNGASFDLPVLRGAFPGFEPPVAHIDLRHVWARLGHGGGLKQLEREMGIGRPGHLRDLDGSAAAWMWRHACNGDRKALRALAEYNLYDAINLRTLAAMAYNRLVARLGVPLPRVEEPGRGDVLYDVSQVLLAL